MSIRSDPCLPASTVKREMKAPFYVLLLVLCVFVGCRREERVPDFFALFCCIEDGYGVMILESNAIQKMLHDHEFFGDSSFVVRRNWEGTQIHIVRTEEPFGGLLVALSGTRVVRGMGGPWVLSKDGDVEDQVPGLKISLRFCPGLVKGPSLEEDWRDLLDFAGAMLDSAAATSPARELEEKDDDRDAGYCFSVDPSATVFSGLRASICGKARPGPALIQGITVTRGGKVYRALETGIAGEALGYCRGEVVLGRWRPLKGEEADHGLELLFVSAGEATERLRWTHTVTVKHPLLGRPVEVVDLDPSCRRLLLVKPKKEDAAAEWFVLWLETGEVQKVYLGAGYGLFLQESWRN